MVELRIKQLTLKNKETQKTGFFIFFNSQN